MFEEHGVDTSAVKQRSRKKLEEKKKREEIEDLPAWKRFLNFFSQERSRMAWGVILMIIGVYLLITFLSFVLYSGGADQGKVYGGSAVQNAGEIVHMTEQNMKSAVDPSEATPVVKNLGGSIGAATAEFFMKNGVGYAAFIIVIWCFVIGLRIMRRRRTNFFPYTFTSLFSILTFSMVVSACTFFAGFTYFRPGGDLGYYANQWLYGLVGLPGMIAVNLILLILWILLCYNLVVYVINTFKKVRKIKMPHRDRGAEDGNTEEMSAELTDFMGDEHSEAAPLMSERKSERRKEELVKEKKVRRVTRKSSHGDKDPDMKIEKAGEIERAKGITNPHDPTGEYMHYRFPTLDLLADLKTNVDNVDVAEQEANKRRIVETLGQYGIAIKTIIAHVGPTVTLFEIVPEEGVRISKIRNLEDDIALSLAALGIRIIAPMPGRGTIGIEVPNKENMMVALRDLLESKDGSVFLQSKKGGTAEFFRPWACVSGIYFFR